MKEIHCLVCDELIGYMPDEKAGKIKPACCTNIRCEKIFRTVTIHEA